MSRSVPPLILLAEGRRPRPRRAPATAPRELALHMAVAGLLRQHARPDWRWGHYPAGEHRDVRTAAKLKAMGVQRGWPDILLIDPRGLLHGLELKRLGEDLTVDQADFRLWAIGRGIPHAVVRTTDEALRVLDAWNCLRLKIGGAV